MNKTQDLRRETPDQGLSIYEKLTKRIALSPVEQSQLKIKIDQKILEKQQLIGKLEGDNLILNNLFEQLSKGREFFVGYFLIDLVEMGVLEKGKEVSNG